MECNKEEAIRAKEIAEKKMQDKDFAGARKIALKAQQLYSNLENISQMLTVCDVHCSSELRVLGTDMNWYSILQLEQTADEASIKKQYRKLALLLHPDKNKFAGAEAAFKLIGEAQRMLSDPLKRSVYDMKYKASLNTATSRQPQQQHRNRNTRKQPVVNITAQQQPPRPPTQPVFNTERQTFWTACPFCNMRYQYYKDILNRALRCQGCTKPFIAYDLNVQGAPPAANWSQSAAPPQSNQFPSQTNFHPSAGFQVPFGFGATAPQPPQNAGVTSEVGRGSKTKAEDGDVNKEEKKESKEGPKFKADKSNRSSKRGRRSGENSSESFGTESSTDSDEYEKFYSRGGVSRQENYASRRSARQKQHVSYNEDLSDDDMRSSKKSKGSRSAAAAAEDQNEASLKEDASEINKHAGSSAASNDDKEGERHKAGNCPGENLPNGNGKAEECKTNKNEAEAMEDNMERTKVDSKVDSDGSNPTKLEPEFFEVPDPDFYDFDKDRKEESFEVDQLWACYDEIDGMPRFYARIRKVFSPGFKLRFTWLEADPDEDEEIVWFNEDLPFACGKFKHGKTETTEDIGMFSHLVYFEKGPRQTIYKILPRKGQVWALFKNWDINWSSDAAKHKEYEFEFVEVLSDYDQESGISVAYLVKVKGFVSLFRLRDEMIPVHIPQNELLRFSHLVPSYKTTGTERENVPKGYFELDPASLPDNIEAVADLEEVKVTTERTDSTINNSCSKIPLQETNMPGMSTDADEKKSQEPRNSGSRSRSPVEQSWGHEKQSRETVGQNTVKEENGKKSHQVNDSFQDGSVPVRMQSDDVETSDSVPEDSDPSEPLFPEFSEIPEAEFCNFDTDRTKDKLLPGQIWALYCEVDGLPKYYARIQKVHSTPDFKIEIKWVEPCSLPNHMIQWSEKDIPISCGMFGLGGSQDFTDTSTFSHLSTAKPTDKKNKYEIYPKKGEVWALYKNFKSEWDPTDVVKADYEMVEVIDANNLMTKVLILERVGDHKSIFKAKEVGVSPISLEIPRVDLLKFSHRIPAFRITTEQDDVRKGFWELDPKAMPICFFR